MPEIDKNILKKLKRKYPELSRVGNNNKQVDRRRQKIMMSTEDYELYLKLTNQKMQGTRDFFSTSDGTGYPKLGFWKCQGKIELLRQVKL